VSGPPETGGTNPTPGDRAARGKAVRERVPRAAHAEWESWPERPDPVELLVQQSSTRVPELVPIRYGRMLLSPFAFFRGAACVMASDLAVAPRTQLRVQLAGDAHLSNFGIFAAPDRRLVFDLNDFDETLPGPFEWDVKRLVASLAIAARERGFGVRERRSATLRAARAYRLAIREYAAMRTLDLWYSRLEADRIAERWGREVRAKRLGQIEHDIARRRAKDHLRAFSRLTEVVGGARRIVSDPPLIIPIEELVPPAEHDRIVAGIRDVYRQYRRTLPDDRRRLLESYRYAHAARKVVGVGSVGTRVWIVLLFGRDESDPLFLQLKEAEPSVAEPFLGRSEFENHGQRVVEGQRLTQAAPDVLLGWTNADDVDGSGARRDYYVRQLWDGKVRASVERMDPLTLGLYGELCATTLAHAHARSGDAIAIASYLGASERFDQGLAAFAERYADQNERDYEALKGAVASGRIVAKTGL
jgi:uncharacterized protein (DUF2252 family)